MCHLSNKSPHQNVKMKHFLLFFFALSDASLLKKLFSFKKRENKVAPLQVTQDKTPHHSSDKEGSTIIHLPTARRMVPKPRLTFIEGLKDNTTEERRLLSKRLQHGKYEKAFAMLRDTRDPHLMDFLIMTLVKHSIDPKSNMDIRFKAQSMIERLESWMRDTNVLADLLNDGQFWRFVDALGEIVHDPDLKVKLIATPFTHLLERNRVSEVMVTFRMLEEVAIDKEELAKTLIRSAVNENQPGVVKMFASHASLTSPIYATLLKQLHNPTNRAWNTMFEMADIKDLNQYLSMIERLHYSLGYEPIIAILRIRKTAMYKGRRNYDRRLAKRRIFVRWIIKQKYDKRWDLKEIGTLINQFLG